MKIINKGIITAAILGASAFAASAAQASDGQVNFVGSVSGTTCLVNGAAVGTMASTTVTLPPVSTNALSSVGSVAGNTAFTLNLTKCSVDTGHVGAYFEMGGTVDAANSDLANQDTGALASNVHVQLVNADGTAILLGKSDWNTENSKAFDIQAGTPAASGNGTATLTYAAQYRATTAAATAGSVHTNVTYSLFYN